MGESQRPINGITTAIVFLFIFLLPLDQQPIVGFLSAPDILLFIGIALTLYQILSAGKVALTKISLIILTGYTMILLTRMIPLISGSWGIDHLKFILTGIAALLIHIMVDENITTKDNLKTAIVILIISATIINGINILQGMNILTLPGNLSRIIRSREIFGIRLPMENRAVAVQTTFGIFGVWSLIALSFSLTDLRSNYLLRKKYNLVAILTISTSLALVLQSRNVWIGLVTVIGLGAVFLSYQFSLLKYNIFKFGLLSSSILVLISLPAFINALRRVNRYTVRSRLEQYNVAIDLFLQNILTGVGRGSLYNILGESLHSLYLQLLLFNTSIGLLVFIYIVIYIGRDLLFLTVIKKSSLAAGTATALAGVLIVVATYPAASTYSLWLLLSLSGVFVSLEMGKISTENHGQ
jgi:hypothetical protein